MRSIRRLYVYFIAGLSLVFLTFGLIEVLQVLFEALSDAVSNVDVSTRVSDQRREDLALFGATTVVAVPIWVLHWWMAQRALRGPNGEDERQSLLRALYFAGALAVAIVLLFPQLIIIVTWALTGLLDVSNGQPLSESLAITLVLSSIWAFQAWNRLKDVRTGPLDQPASWPVRLYTYLAVLIGAIVLIIGLVNLVILFADLIYAGDGVDSDQWWQRLLIDSVAGIAVGGLIWGLHWWYTRRLVTGANWQAEPEQHSVLRRGYLYLMVFVGIVGGLTALIVALQQPLEYLFGLLDDQSGRQIVRDIFLPLLLAVVFALIWLFHRRQIVIEARAYAENKLQASIRRLYVYLLAGIGLAFGVVSLAYLVGIVLEIVIGDGRSTGIFNDPWREEVSQFVPAAVIGIIVWLWQWRRILGWMSTQPDVERKSLTRRIYLYAVLAISVVAVLFSLSILVYRLFTVLLSVAGASGLSSDLSTIAGVLFVASAILVYHGWLVWQDAQARSVMKQETASTTLILTAPAGADLDAAMAHLQEQLVEGFTLERE